MPKESRYLYLIDSAIGPHKELGVIVVETIFSFNGNDGSDKIDDKNDQIKIKICNDFDFPMKLNFLIIKSII